MSEEIKVLRENDQLNVSDVIDEIKPVLNDTVSFDTHRKLLGEKKSLQAKLDEATTWRKDQEQAKQIQDGNHQEVITSLREDLKKERTTNLETTQKVAFDKFSNQVSAVAKDLGCVDTSTLTSLMTKEQMASVQIDDRLNANSDDLTRLVAEMKEARPYMFGGQTINHSPVSGASFNNKPKMLNDMSKDDIVGQLKANY